MTSLQYFKLNIKGVVIVTLRGGGSGNYVIRHLILLIFITQIIREPFDYICQVKGKEIRVKLIEVRVH